MGSWDVKLMPQVNRTLHSSSEKVNYLRICSNCKWHLLWMGNAQIHIETVEVFFFFFFFLRFLEPFYMSRTGRRRQLSVAFLSLPLPLHPWSVMTTLRQSSCAPVQRDRDSSWFNNAVSAKNILRLWQLNEMRRWSTGRWWNHTQTSSS